MPTRPPQGDSPNPNTAPAPTRPALPLHLDPGRALAMVTDANAEAHAAFLKQAERTRQLVAQQLAFQMDLLTAAIQGRAPLPTASPALAPPAAPVEAPGAPQASPGALGGASARANGSSGFAATTGAQEHPGPPQGHVAVEEAPGREVWLDRAQCLEFAVGSIAAVLGPEFAEVDTFPTRVRLPAPPLMLVDRMIKVEGEPLSMGAGRLWTEHDVKEGAWYLDGGRIPTCVAVESGQADLFLSGYLGIDFKTRGEAVYRLLDATCEFHGELPKPGDTIVYDIRIERFLMHGGVWLFQFFFDATVDGRPLMSMRDGSAGFFTEERLAEGQGIVKSRLETTPRPGVRPDDWRELAPLRDIRPLDAAHLAALRAGDLAAAFGPDFAGLELKGRPLTIPGGLMELVHRVIEIDPTGGRYGLGVIRAEADIHPDDWFITCHFVDDQVMPGTLMYECCLHTLRVFLLRLGWVGVEGEVAAQPVPGVKSRLKCRGQVLGSTRVVTYEVAIKELGYRPEPYAIVDALMYADGKPIVDIGDMSLRLTGLERGPLEAMWAEARRAEAEGARVPDPAAIVPFDRWQMLAFADGDPSQAFGPRFRPFDRDQPRQCARLPRAPFLMADRVVAANADPLVLRQGAWCEMEVDLSGEDWYFTSNRQAEIPFAVLLEMSLQACGWLAAYAGSALTSEVDLRFRNLGGDAALLSPVVVGEADTLKTYAEMTGVSRSAGMIIQRFTFRTWSVRTGETVYEGTTSFGFFSLQALATQVGLGAFTPRALTDREQAASRAFPVPRHAPMPDDVMRMVANIDRYVPDGGDAGLGYALGSIEVNPEAWFFHAHFFEDPVWPGSLGLEAFLQVLKVIAIERWGLGPEARFKTAPLGERHRWAYRGQVLPTAGRVQVEATVTAVDEARGRLVASGLLAVDGLAIYKMDDFALEVERP